MAKLPLLQKLLNRRKRKELRLEIVANCNFSGINFLLLIKESDKNDITLKNVINKHFIPLMKSDYSLEEASLALKKYNINIDEKYFLEGIMFIVFKKEL